MQYINGDITNVTEGLVIHGTNCSGGFGSGVAGAIRRKWPEVVERFYEKGMGKHLLGYFDPVKIDDKLTVANCYTQLNFGGDGKRYADPVAVNLSVSEAFIYANHKGIKTIHMPKIGCGLGGLDWDNDVLPIVEALSRYFKDSVEVKIYYI